MVIELAPGFQARLRITPVNDAGHPVPVQVGSVEWGTSDPAVLAVAPNPADEAECVVRRVGLGVAKAQVRADADPGAGVVTLTAEAELAVTEGLATSLSLSAVVEPEA